MGGGGNGGNPPITITNVSKLAVNGTIDALFQAIWQPKLNKVEIRKGFEYIGESGWARIQAGESTIPESWTIIGPETDPRTGFTVMKAQSDVTYDPYSQLLELANKDVESGLSAEQAVADLMNQKLGQKADNEKTGLFNTLNFKLELQDSLAGKVWCGSANCVQQAMVVKELLADLGVTDTKIVYGLGGNVPFVHSVIVTPEGVITFGGKIIPIKTFLRYTKMIKALGNYLLPW